MNRSLRRQEAKRNRSLRRRRSLTHDIVADSEIVDPPIDGSARPEIGSLFADGAAGMMFSGDSGSGKTNAMLVVMQAIARRGIPLVFITPHGQDAVKLRDQLLSTGSRRRLIYIAPGDPSCPIPRLNPLKPPAHLKGPYAEAAIVNKVGHLSRIILQAFGDDSFNSMTRLFTWFNRSLTQLALLGRPPVDVTHLMDVGSDRFFELVQAMADGSDKSEFLRLAEQRSSDTREELESSRNRLLGFFRNPLTRHLLGSASDTLDFRKAMLDRKIIIVNLEPGGVLRKDDQQTLANIFLAEILHTVFNMSASELVPYFSFIDELPVFSPSFAEIASSLAQVRKFNFRWGLAYQGTNVFPDRTDDPLLHATISQCAMRFMFNHTNPLDACFFADVVGLQSYDPLLRKYEHIVSEQYQDGHEEIQLVDRAENWVESEQQGSTDSNSWGTQDSRNRDRDSNATQDKKSINHTHARSGNRSRGRSHGGSVSYKTSLIANMEWRDVVRSVEFFSASEQKTLIAQRIATMPIGSCIFQANGQEPAIYQFPLAASQTGLRRSRQRRLQRYLAELAQNPAFDYLKTDVVPPTEPRGDADDGNSYFN